MTKAEQAECLKEIILKARLKTEMEENEKSIDEIIEEEIQYAKQTPPLKISPELEKKNQAAYSIAKSVVNLVKSEPNEYYLTQETITFLFNSIKRFELDSDEVHFIFWNIQESLASELPKLDPLSQQYRYLLISLKTLNYRAVNYFVEYLVEEFKGVHIAEILFRVKRTLNDLRENNYSFFQEALLQVKRNVEERIELRKEEKRNREEMYEILDKEDNIGLPIEQFDKDKNLTLDRGVLFLDYLFNYAKTSSFKTEKAKAISFLTGYDCEGVRQRLSTIYTDKKKNLKSFKKDLRIVRNLFNRLGLSEIVRQIDEELD